MKKALELLERGLSPEIFLTIFGVDRIPVTSAARFKAAGVRFF